MSSSIFLSIHPSTALFSLSVKASYDAIAPRYNEWTIPHSTTRLRYLDQLLDRLPTTISSSPSTPVSVLELGCGYGVPVTRKLLSHLNFSVTANDLSSAQLALARASLLPSRLARLTAGSRCSRATCSPSTSRRQPLTPSSAYTRSSTSRALSKSRYCTRSWRG